MIMTLDIFTLIDQAHAARDSFAAELSWQPNVIYFWQGLFDRAPDESYRRAYAAKLNRAKLNLEALQKFAWCVDMGKDFW